MKKILFIALFFVMGCEEDTQTNEEVDTSGCPYTDSCNYSPDGADEESCWYASDGCYCQDGEGAVVDICGVCNGNGEDVDQDGICDDIDDCVGQYDICDVCNGDGSTCGLQGDYWIMDYGTLEMTYNGETTTQTVTCGELNSPGYYNYYDYYYDSDYVDPFVLKFDTEGYMHEYVIDHSFCGEDIIDLSEAEYFESTPYTYDDSSFTIPNDEDYDYPFVYNYEILDAGYTLSFIYHYNFEIDTTYDYNTYFEYGYTLTYELHRASASGDTQMSGKKSEGVSLLTLPHQMILDKLPK